MKDKNFFLSIGIFLLLITGLAVASILVQQRQLIRKKAAGENASLTLPTSLSVDPSVDPQFSVPVMVNTDGAAISAVDVVLDFSADKNKISLINIIPEAAEGTSLKTFAPVDEDGAFNLASILNEANTTGLIEFGAVTFDWEVEEVTTPFNGVLGPTNPLATLTFEVIEEATGQATINIVHTPGETIDSNLVNADRGDDILANANTLIVNIGVEATPTPTPTSELTPTPTPTITLTPTPTPTEVLTPTPTPTSIPDTGNLRFQIRFQGISGDKPVAKKVRGILKQDGEEVYRDENITVENDGTGIFVDMFRNIAPGKYDVLIKGPAHLQKNFGEIEFIAGQTIEKDWTADDLVLLAGDITGVDETPPDNIVNAADYGIFAGLYDPFNLYQNLYEPGTREYNYAVLADFNADGYVNAPDYGLLAGNFDPFGGGDE